MSGQKPFTYQFIIERWADGLKVLGAANGSGLLASGASLQFFAATPEILRSIKVGAAFFLAGILLFAVAFLFLTTLPLIIERFLASSADKTYGTFVDMINDMTSANKGDRRAYLALALSSVFSVLCFFAGCWPVYLKSYYSNCLGPEYPHESRNVYLGLHALATKLLIKRSKVWVDINHLCEGFVLQVRAGPVTSRSTVDRHGGMYRPGVPSIWTHPGGRYTGHARPGSGERLALVDRLDRRNDRRRRRY